MGNEYKFFAGARLNEGEEHYGITKLDAEKIAQIAPKHILFIEKNANTGNDYLKKGLYNSLEDILKDPAFKGIMDIDKFRTPEMTHTVWLDGIEVDDLEEAIQNIESSLEDEMEM